MSKQIWFGTSIQDIVLQRNSDWILRSFLNALALKPICAREDIGDSGNGFN